MVAGQLTIFGLRRKTHFRGILAIMRLRDATLFLAACALCSCNSGRDATSNERTILALGTIIEIEIIGTDEHRADQALDEVEILLREIQHDWYAFGDGELGRANEMLWRGQSVEISAALAALVRRSLELRKLSDGFFEPAIGELVELWGFGSAVNPPSSPPPAAAIARWVEQLPIRESLRIDEHTVSADGPLKLDFGGIAKGTTLTRLSKRLHEMDIDNAIINAGGDLIVLGQHGSRPWRVGIRDPNSEGVLGAITLAPGEAIVTSGNYERFFKIGEQRFHHLLDPHTGRPVTETASVTVVDFDAELADAAATALMAAGPKNFARIAGQMGISTAMLVTDEGEILLTDTMAERIEDAGVTPEPQRAPQDINKTVNCSDFRASSRV
jgi:thiamine biosynthesis lipoprotein